MRGVPWDGFRAGVGVHRSLVSTQRTLVAGKVASRIVLFLLALVVMMALAVATGAIDRAAPLARAHLLLWGLAAVAYQPVAKLPDGCEAPGSDTPRH
jgi:hypothetical protein